MAKLTPARYYRCAFMVGVAQRQSPSLWYWWLRVRIPSLTHPNSLYVDRHKAQTPPPIGIRAMRVHGRRGYGLGSPLGLQQGQGSSLHPYASLSVRIQRSPRQTLHSSLFLQPLHLSLSKTTSLVLGAIYHKGSNIVQPLTPS